MRHNDIEQSNGALVLWHRTSERAAKQIVASGFRDATSHGAHFEVTGVWLSNRPLGVSEGTKGGELLRVVVTATEAEIEAFELVDETSEGTYREWCIPAAWLADHATVERIDDDDPRIPDVEWPRWDEEADR